METDPSIMKRTREDRSDAESSLKSQQPSHKKLKNQSSNENESKIPYLSETKISTRHNSTEFPQHSFSSDDVSIKVNIASSSEIFAPIRTLYDENNQELPISYADLIKLIDHCKNPINIKTLAQECTNDVPSLTSLLERCHSLITNKKMKKNLKLIQTVLNKN